MMELRSLDFDTADSKEEVHFSWWLNELHEAGYISDWQYQPRTFDLSETITYGVEVQLKTKVRIDEKCLMQKHTYTPDFRISWNVDAKHLFYSNINCGVDIKKCLIVAQGGISHIDIKPKAWGNNSFMEAFKLNQKWVYSKYGVFVQPVVTWGGATSCFEATFCPARFIYTDKTRKIRELKFTARSLDMFLKIRRG